MKTKLLLSAMVAGAAGLMVAAAPAQAQVYGHNPYGPNNGPVYTQNGSADVILYDQKDFRGRTLQVNGAVSSMSDYGFNDAASSIRVLRGQWEVCVDGDFRGRCEIINGSLSDANYVQMNNNISSIRRVGSQYGYNNNHGNQYGNRPGHSYGNNGHNGYGNGHGQPGYGGQYADIVLYEDSNFSGRAMPVNGNLVSFSQTGLNDEISSIRVNQGRWQICTDAGFNGRCEVITRSTNALNNIRMNDNISSIRRIG